MEEMTKEVAMQALKGMPPQTLQQFSAIPPTQKFESISACANVTEALLQRGYSEDDTKKIMGGNWLRLYQQVWK
jgi:microsomal dipeptidase-like Zn-dependent dipeptidase